jgi:predicted Zn-dependent protease
MALLATLALLVAAYPAEDPFMMSDQQQIEIGEKHAAEIRKKEKVLPATNGYVKVLRRVGDRLVKAADDGTKWRYTFDVIQSDQVNAFALPGGPVFFYTGLLSRLKTEDELAGVLAHELTHVRREHSARQYADAVKRELGFAAVLGLLGANKEVRTGAAVANSAILGTRFSRQHETQADDDGYKLMVQAGYNPQGLADVFAMLGSLAASKPPEWMSTHPNDANRVKRIENRIRKEGKKYPPQKPIRWG